MSNEDGAGSTMNSTDTSQLLRELEALNNSGSSSALQGTVTSGEIGGSGDATITQLMQTMYGSQTKQKIVLTGGEDEENSFGVFAQEVDICVPPLDEGSPRAASNKVKIKTVVQYMWEQQFYHGDLVAVHRDGDFLAFVIKIKTGSAVRIIHQGCDDRKLIKGFVGNVVDVAFAHSTEAIVAGVDDLGCLLVHSCKLSATGDIVLTPLLHIQSSDSKVCAYNRVIWCPYWPDEGEDTDSDIQDSSKVLACTHGGQIDLFAVDIVTRDCGPGPLNPTDIESGKITLLPHTEPVVEAVFSPDGSALASASLNGEVKFFQIRWSSTSEDNAECLHEWKPHNGQPLSFFTFLDDLKNMSPDAQFWKFAVTGCNNNQELKVWSCETWTCLQTVRFVGPMDGVDEGSLTLKAGIDLSSRYIVLSDKDNMVMYVLQVYQDTAACRAHVSSVAYFPQTQSCLSFAIIDVSTKKFKTSLNDSHLDDITTGEVEEDGEQDQLGGDDEAGETMIGVQLRLYAIHPRALQRLVIHYRPESSVSIRGSAASMSHDGLSIRDGLSDVSGGVETSFAAEEGEETVEDVEPVVPPPRKLLSPDAFTMSSSSKLVSPSSASAAGAAAAGGGHNTTTTTDDVLSSTSSFTQVTGLTGHNAEDLLLSPDTSTVDDQTSPHHHQHHHHHARVSPQAALSPKSPGSALTPKSGNSTLTPKSAYSGEDMDPGEELTPSGIPLPPEQDGELATPKSSRHSAESSQLDALEAFFKPSPSSSQPAGDATTPQHTGTFEVDSDETGDAQNDSTSSPTPIQQAPASATTDTYDENDQEVAEVLGEDMDKSFSSTGSGAAAAAAAVVAAPEFPAAPAAVTDDSRPHKPWPRPPDVPAANQAAMVTTTTLPQAMDEAIITSQDDDDAGEGDDDDDFEDQAEEAEVEEEIEEVLEEAEDDDDEEDNDDDDEGDDFGKTYQGVIIQESSRVKVIREMMDPGMMTELQDSIRQLSQEVSRQQQHLHQLQRQMVDQHEMQVDLQRQQLEQASLRSAAHPTRDLEKQVGRLENVVTSRVERTMQLTLQKETKLLHDRLTSSDSRQTSFLQSLEKAVTHTLTSSIHKSLEGVVRNEIKQNVAPILTRTTEQMKSQLHTDTTQRLAAMEAVVKDQINKIVRSRQTTDAIGQAASSAMMSQGQEMMKQIVETRIIPSFSLTADTMMTQMNAIFQQGTNEYFSHLRKQLEKVRQEQESGREPLVQQLTALVDTFQQSSTHLHQQVSQSMRHEISHQIKQSLSSLQDQLLSGLRATVRDEVSTALKEQGSKMTDSLASYLRSGAATPVPLTPEVNNVQALQEQLRQLVARKKMDRAFQLALSASNLELVVFVCELVDTAELFGATPCMLSQPVLLSLIQQLSADLPSSFNTKIKFLTEAVTTLDISDQVTKEHVPMILEGLVTKLRAYQSTNPPSRELRLLLMATNSLLASAQ